MADQDVEAMIAGQASKSAEIHLLSLSQLLNYSSLDVE